MEQHTITDEELRGEAERIHDEILEARIELPDGESGWVGYDVMDGKPILTGGEGLYSGQIGIATYFASMYRVFGDERYRQQASDAVEFLFTESADDIIDHIIKLGNLGSLVYGLSVISDLTGRKRYQDRAVELATAISEDKIRTDDSYSILLGTGGTLMGLLRLYERSNERAVLEKATECGEHLLESRDDKWGYKVWDTNWNNEVESCSTGMGHGAGGIGYSLYRLYAHTQREEYRDAADDAIEFEDVFYSEYEENWKSNWTSPPYYSLWWCFGLSGIGLSRIGSLEYVDSPDLRRDLDRAKRFDPKLAPTDMVCHGTFSQVDFLVELGRKCDDGFLEEARTLAAKSVARRHENGSYKVVLGDHQGVHNPVFFLGTAGIGYTLLRLLQPGEIPSILRFE